MLGAFSNKCQHYAVVPEGLKNSVRAVLLSKLGGVLMTQFLSDFEELVKEPLNFKRLGFETLEAFLRAIPDTARMEYSPKDSTMRIFGVARPNTYMNKVTKKAQGQIPASHLREIENHAPGQNHVDTSNIKTEPQLQSPREQNHAAQTRVQVKTEKQFQAPSNTGHHGSENVVPSVDLSSLQPDERGWFSLCFPESKAPNVESLEDLFGEAGPVKAVHRGAGYIFIRYDTPEAVQRAFQLFGFLDLRLGYNRKSKNTPAGSNASNKRQYPQHTSHQNEAEVRTYKYMADPSRVRIAQDHSGETEQGEMRTRSLSEKSSVAESPPSATYAGSEPDQFSTELFLGNIPNDRECTKEMVKELFQPYNLVHLYWKRSKKKTFAFALLHSRRDAEEAMQKLNGYDLMGRPLKIRMSDIKVASRVGEIKSPKTAALPRTSKGKLFDHITEYGLMPDLEEDMPDLEEDSSDEGSTAGTEILRRRYDVVPNPEITRQVIASGGYSLHITRRVDPTHSTQGDFGSEVIRRMGPQPGNSGDAGSVMQQRVDTRAKYNVEEETEEPCILVANFRKDTTKEELRALFFRYHPQHVEIISSPKCTKAMIKLATVADVKAAVAEMNQEAYMGQRLLVDVPFQCPLLRAAVLGPEAVGKKAPDKIAPSEVLKAHVRIMATLKAKESKVLLGERIEVLVTCAITDSFLWGQIDTDSRQRLKHIMTELNMNPDKREDRATGPGPCKALFDGDGQWYRAWVIGSVGAMAQVFYIDYGNAVTIPWTRTAKLTDPKMWELRPMATPFMLVDKIMNLKEKELTFITVEVAARADAVEGNCVIAKPISLIGNLPSLAVGQTFF